MSGSDKPPRAAYTEWATLTECSTTWDQLTPAQQVIWESVATRPLQQMAKDKFKAKKKPEPPSELYEEYVPNIQTLQDVIDAIQKWEDEKAEKAENVKKEKR